MDRALWACKKFLDHHDITGIAKDLLDHDLADGGRGFFLRLGDHDTLAKRKTIGLHHKGVTGALAMG
jgi:hypothetical protein